MGLMNMQSAAYTILSIACYSTMGSTGFGLTLNTLVRRTQMPRRGWGHSETGKGMEAHVVRSWASRMSIARDSEVASTDSEHLNGKSSYKTPVAFAIQRFAEVREG